MGQTPILNIFTGSMNKDRNPSFLEQGDYADARNCRIGFSEESNVGCVENIIGTLEIVNDDLKDKTGRFQTIGEAPFEAGSTVYYFVCDTVGQEHAIYEFNLLIRSISLVIKGAQLGFDIDHKISSCFYFNDMLFWVFGDKDISQIFVSLAKSNTRSYLTSDSITLIKAPPSTAITGIPMKSKPLATSFLGTTQYQFIYRYVYIGNMYSVWSISSKTIGVTNPDPANPTDFIRLTLSDIKIKIADLYLGQILYIEVGFRTDDTQPYRFFERIDFPKTRVNEITVDFYNSAQYPVIPTDETGTGLFFHDVPPSVVAMEFAQGRVLTGDNASGFDEIKGIISSIVSDDNNIPVDAGNYFVEGGMYSIGIEVLDGYDRRSFVYPAGGFTAAKRNGLFRSTSVKLSVSGRLPDWAVSWRPVITRCLNKGKVLQAHITVVSADSTKIVFGQDFVLSTPAAYAWVFTTGDRVSFLASNDSGGGFADDKSNMVLTLNSDNNFEVAGDFTGVVTGAIVEFFVPIKGSLTAFYYEIGETYPVDSTPSGKFFGTDIGGTGKAITITGGDSFYLLSDDCQRVNLDINFFETWFYGGGRDNVVSLTVQKRLVDTSSIWYSDPYVQGSLINGLNAFGTLSKKTYPVELGAINRLITGSNYQANGTVLLVVTPTSLYSVYLGLIQTFNSDGTSNLVASDQLLGTYNLLAGQGGSSDPASVFRWGTNIMGWNNIRGIQWRYAQDGATHLSVEHGMNSYLSNLARTSIIGEAKSCYDPFFDEWLLFLKTPEGGSVLAFNEDKNGYSVFYDMQPDWMCTLNREVITWKNGALYLHRAGEINDLHGTKVESSITYSAIPGEKRSTTSTNESAMAFNTVNPQAIWVYAQDPWGVEIKGIDRTNKAVQSVSMPPAAGNYEEDKYAFQIKPDQVTRQSIKSRYLLVKLTLALDVSTLSVLYGAQVNESNSDPNKSGIK